MPRSSEGNNPFMESAEAAINKSHRITSSMRENTKNIADITKTIEKNNASQARKSQQAENQSNTNNNISETMRHSTALLELLNEVLFDKPDKFTNETLEKHGQAEEAVETNTDEIKPILAKSRKDEESIKTITKLRNVIYAVIKNCELPRNDERGSYNRGKLIKSFSRELHTKLIIGEASVWSGTVSFFKNIFTPSDKHYFTSPIILFNKKSASSAEELPEELPEDIQAKIVAVTREVFTKHGFIV